jgi:hypothetical protein
MKCFENRGMDKAAQTFMENVFLAVLEFILEEGVDKALRHLSDITEEDVRVFPNVRNALKERGMLK